MQIRTLIAYSIPAFAISLPTIPIYIYLPTLYGVELELGLTATGLVLLVTRIIDTATDPIIGILSDRVPIKKNHRKPWLTLGCVIAAVGLYRLVNPPENVTLFYLFMWSVTLYIGWTLVAVPYLTWGAELSIDYNERTTITTFRELAGIIGILACGVIVAVASINGLTELESASLIGWVAISLGCLSIPYLLLKVPDANIIRGKDRRKSRESFAKDCLKLIYNKPFIRLLSAWFLNGLANGIPSVLFFLFLGHVLGVNETQRAILILIYFFSAVLAMPIWLFFSKIIGKHRIWCYAMIIAIGAFLTVPLMPEGSFYPFAAICILTGMSLGADLSIPPSIQADVMDYDKLKFGELRAGLLFSLWGMITKLALGCSVGLAFPLLEWLGFQSEAPGEHGKFILVMLYALLPVCFKIITVAIIWNFPLTQKKQDIIRRRLYGSVSKVI